VWRQMKSPGRSSLYRIFEFDQGVRMTHELIDSRVHPEDALMCREVIERALGDGSDVEFEHRLADARPLD